MLIPLLKTLGGVALHYAVGQQGKAVAARAVQQLAHAVEGHGLPSGNALDNPQSQPLASLLRPSSLAELRGVLAAHPHVRTDLIRMNGVIERGREAAGAAYLVAGDATALIALLTGPTKSETAISAKVAEK